jgi:calcyclin binding protein
VKNLLSKINKIIDRVYLTDGFADLKSHPSDKIKATYTANSVDVYIENWKGKSFRFSCMALNKDIIPEESHFKQGSSGLTLFLKKAKTETWDSLNKKESIIKDPSNKKPGAEGGDDPSAGIMDMMKQMYQNGDE